MDRVIAVYMYMAADRPKERNPGPGLQISTEEVWVKKVAQESKGCPTGWLHAFYARLAYHCSWLAHSALDARCMGGCQSCGAVYHERQVDVAKERRAARIFGAIGAQCGWQVNQMACASRGWNQDPGLRLLPKRAGGRALGNV